MRTRRTLRGHLAKIYAMHWGTDSRWVKSGLCAEPSCSLWAEAGWAGAALHIGRLKQDARVGKSVWEDLTAGETVPNRAGNLWAAAGSCLSPDGRGEGCPASRGAFPP